MQVMVAGDLLYHVRSTIYMGWSHRGPNLLNELGRREMPVTTDRGQSTTHALTGDNVLVAMDLSYEPRRPYSWQRQRSLPKCRKARFLDR